MYETWFWHIYNYAFGFLFKIGCDTAQATDPVVAEECHGEAEEFPVVALYTLISVFSFQYGNRVFGYLGSSSMNEGNSLTAHGVCVCNSFLLDYSCGYVSGN